MYDIIYNLWCHIWYHKQLYDIIQNVMITCIFVMSYVISFVTYWLICFFSAEEKKKLRRQAGAGERAAPEWNSVFSYHTWYHTWCRHISYHKSWYHSWYCDIDCCDIMFHNGCCQSEQRNLGRHSACSGECAAEYSCILVITQHSVFGIGRLAQVGECSPCGREIAGSNPDPSETT